MRLFYFERTKDISGVSGTGRVLEGVEFTDGTVAIRWLSEHASTAIYATLEEFEKIHGHHGLGHINFDFWSNVNTESHQFGVDGKYPTECWTWKGRLEDGYGKVWDKTTDKTVGAHRIAYKLAYKDPGKQCVLHKCDNRACVRPDHLFTGSRADNSRDMDTKGRRVSVSGERHGRSKLTRQQVKAIREEYPTIGYQKLSVKYHVSKAAIRNIVKNKTWS